MATPRTIKEFFKPVERFFARCKQRLIIQYLMWQANGKRLVKKYRNHPVADGEEMEAITPTSPIWTCWWQGEEQMPMIVKACYRAMQKHAGNHPVILITEKNYQEYVELPEAILAKQQAGIIDLTHFSDILRMSLLCKYGGIWMDSTLFIPAKDVDSFIDPTSKYWSCHHQTRYNNVSRGGWVSFFVACGRNNPLPAFIADLHIAYWLKHNRLIDYLLLDYAFAIARTYLPTVHNMIEALPLTAMGPLGKCLNKVYSAEEWQEHCTLYNFHKLTYKIPLSPMTPDGKKSWYGHILEVTELQTDM
ncbi:MAG: capsular polysaccharide synthesis protein [Alistipes sp.]|nr:capsular polysaccharide synthesis protein [Alistipes sp.]